MLSPWPCDVPTFLANECFTLDCARLGYSTLLMTETIAPGDEHIEHITRPPQSLWNRILAEPDRAPEYIALVAAERFGPQAEEWVRIAGPGHTPAAARARSPTASTCGLRASRAGRSASAAPSPPRRTWWR